MRLLASEPDDREIVLSEFESVVRDCAGLVGYPLEPLVKVLVELGKYIGESAAYERLFETLTNVASARHGEVEAARMLLQHGIHHLKAERPYQAIRSFGRSLRRLHKHESRHDAVRAYTPAELPTSKRDYSGRHAAQS